MIDVQKHAPEVPIPIDRVGVRGVKVPLWARDRANLKQRTVASVDLSVDLPASFKGTHMSRFVEAIENWEGEISYKSVRGLLAVIRDRLEACRAQVCFHFPYFIRMNAPATGTPGEVAYNCMLTGELNEIGEAVAANVPDSYRMGIELMAGLKLPCGFQWDINATLSRNRVENFTETLYENEDPAGEKWSTYLGDTHIAFSPDFLLNNRFGYTYKGFEASLQSQYVSKQYMSNLDCKDHILDAYFVSNLNLSYTYTLPKIKSVTIGCTVYNLFNEEYENNGYAGSGFYYEDGQKVRYNYAGYAAQAGTNVLGHISLRF